MCVCVCVCVCVCTLVLAMTIIIIIIIIISIIIITDIDECLVNNGGCDDLCINKRGSYECRCETRGWMLDKDDHSCVGKFKCSHWQNQQTKSYICKTRIESVLLGGWTFCFECLSCTWSIGGLPLGLSRIFHPILTVHENYHSQDRFDNKK